MRSDEDRERDCDPGPAALDEQGVEDVVLARKVTRRLGRDVRAARGIVRRGAGLRAQQREQRAEYEERRVREEDKGFGRRW